MPASPFAHALLLAPWILCCQAFMALGVVMARAARPLGAALVWPSAVWGAAMVAAATVLFFVAARVALASAGAGPSVDARRLAHLGAVLVVMGAWASLVLIFVPGAGGGAP